MCSSNRIFCNDERSLALSRLHPTGPMTEYTDKYGSSSKFQKRDRTLRIRRYFVDVTSISKDPAKLNIFALLKNFFQNFF